MEATVEDVMSDWQGPEKAWWKEASIYQIYPASFFDSNADGIGDIHGVQQKTAYLKALGVDVVWLCPVYESPQVDMGYDISDYCAIHAPYGTLEDVQNLVQELHQNGMKLIMDLVVNHTSSEHQWFQESKSSLTNEKRDWYIWRKPIYDEAGQRHPPNNWASVFGGSAWTYDDQTAQYYLHLFCKEQPDLNWENPQVVEAVHEVMEFWLANGVDGFRMDVINLISKTPGLPNAPVTTHGPHQPAHLHYANGPRLHEHLRGLRNILDKYDAFAVGEMPWVKEKEQVLKAVASPRRELNMIFQFDIVDMDIGDDGKFSSQPWTLDTLRRIVDKWQTSMYEGAGWNALFLENHDQSRSISRFTPHQPENRRGAATMLATFIGMQSGTLFIYQGQELGMKNLPEEWSIEEYKDFETQNLYQIALARFANDETGLKLFLKGVHSKARDHARSPFQWNAAAHGGFSTFTPWMRANDDYLQCNAAQQVSDPTSIFMFWKRVLQLRKQYKDVLVYGQFRLIEKDSLSVICYQKFSQDAIVTVILNFTEDTVEWTTPRAISSTLKNGRILLTNYANITNSVGSKLCLRPFEVLVVVESQRKSRL